MRRSLETGELDIRMYDGTAIVRDIQKSKATYKREKVALSVRVSQVWIDDDGQWKIVAIQFSPMAEG